MTAPPAPAHTAPSLRRRLACFTYEAVLLFGVLMISGYLYSSLTQQRHALQGVRGLQAFEFLILAIYFAWFWSRGGQTVAMKTWGIRLLRRDGSAVTQARALMRYLLAWLWFLPALGLLELWGLKGAGVSFAVLLAGVLAYAALARLHPSRQFLHDVVCGTQLVNWPPRPAVNAGAVLDQNAAP